MRTEEYALTLNLIQTRKFLSNLSINKLPRYCPVSLSINSVCLESRKRAWLDLFIVFCKYLLCTREKAFKSLRDSDLIDSKGLKLFDYRQQHFISQYGNELARAWRLTDENQTDEVWVVTYFCPEMLLSKMIKVCNHCGIKPDEIFIECIPREFKTDFSPHRMPQPLLKNQSSPEIQNSAEDNSTELYKGQSKDNNSASFFTESPFLQEETQQVQSLLCEEFNFNSDNELQENGENEYATTDPIENNKICAKISKLLLEKNVWNYTELKLLCVSNKLMINRAIDMVNEWSDNLYGDFLIEEINSEYRLNMDIVFQIKSQENK